MNVLSPVIEVASISLSTVLAEDMCRASIETAALPRWLYPDGDRFEFRYLQIISSNSCSPSDCFSSSYLGFCLKFLWFHLWFLKFTILESDLEFGLDVNFEITSFERFIWISLCWNSAFSRTLSSTHNVLTDRRQTE